MKNTRNTLLTPMLLALLLISSCDPNKEIYEMLDAERVPYKKKIEYTLTNADYIWLGGVINTYKAFNDTLNAKEYVPRVLARNFLALNLESSAKVTFNHLMLNPIWWEAGFGYELTPADYQYIGVDNAFTETNPASANLPFFLLKKFPEAQEGETKSIIYNFNLEEETIKNIDVYKLEGGNWLLEESRENIPFVGYEMLPEDYANFGGSIEQNNNFSEANNPDLYLPSFLRYKFPFDPPASERVIKYKYFSGGQTKDEIDKYVFDGSAWQKTPVIEQRTEQYVFGEQGWAFDPTVTFQLSKDDYMYLAVIDPIPHPVYTDFGYYWGSSAYYSNFDIRLIGRRLNKKDDGTYWDPELGEIYENEGSEAATDEMYRRILEEGFIYTLQNKFPDAVPQIGGIDVYYIIKFETFADGFIRRYPEAKYKCSGAGNPPTFEFIEVKGRE